MKIKKLMFLFLLFGINFAIGQSVYYKLQDKPVMSENHLEMIKKAYANVGEFKVRVISTDTKKDSIIKNIAFDMVKLNEKQEKYTSPFAKHEAKKGLHFAIEKFYAAEKKPFAADFLQGKPSIVNFWFTRCLPCIEEIPILNALKKEFGNTVNFIAITFDSKGIVDAFLLKKNIDFQHITDAKKQLNEMEISAYPMNLILDKDGKIVEVSGNFDDKKEVSKTLKKLL